ncbi:MAG: class I SAM-dependent DNA methyltransferase [Acidimicrobiales bacterium]
MSDGIFDERVAPGYDARSAPMFEQAVLGPTVAFLAELAGDGRALEFASGTGRVALPLQAAGVDVHGIELSRAMLAQMRGKPGGDGLPVTVGDMATTFVDGQFSLVYLVYNTIGNLLSQAEQVDCFRNAAAHLEAGGRFVVEMWVPELRRLLPGERFVISDFGDGHIEIDEYDVVTQGLISHHYWPGGEVPDSGFAAAFETTPQRYVWPSELDLMAQLAGLELAERWSTWSREPFTAESPSHVSVWRRA